MHSNVMCLESLQLLLCMLLGIEPSAPKLCLSTLCLFPKFCLRNSTIHLHVNSESDLRQDTLQPHPHPLPHTHTMGEQLWLPGVLHSISGFQGAGLCVTGHDCPWLPSSFTIIRMSACVSSPSQCLFRRKTKSCTAAPWRGFMLINFRAQCVFCFNSIPVRHFHTFQSFYPAFWLFQAWEPKLSKGKKFSSGFGLAFSRWKRVVF